MNPQPTPSVAAQIADTFVQIFGRQPGFRLVHSKGIVLTGSFRPEPGAAQLSRAAHFQTECGIVARFSNAAGLPALPDGDPNNMPQGFAIRFTLPDGATTDIVTNAGNGFVAATPADFLAFVQALATTGPDSPHPNPVERYFGARPAAAKIAMAPKQFPASFATQSYFSNNALIFVNAEGRTQAFRYQIHPVGGEARLDEAALAAKGPQFLFEELAERISQGPIEFRLTAQLAAPGDPVDDATAVWPSDRPLVELGTITLNLLAPNSDEAQKELALDPTNLIDGIEVSDDPLLPLRREIYAISVARRREAQ
jgi:catalase